MTKVLAGIDIGGTKCAVSLGEPAADGVRIIARESFPTPHNASLALERFKDVLKDMLEKHASACLVAIGISCGGPLDSKKGLIMSPPNLPSWDHIPVISFFQEHFGVAVALQNDANACAYAEWRWGAGRNTRNMIFLTFGTGMGAGLILDGRLYSGTNDMAGEVGHIRLADQGPVGFGKPGSFEGFCSGGGIARLAKSMAKEWLQAGKSTLIAPSMSALDDEHITAKTVGEAAQQDDELARLIYRTTGEKLGYALSILIDTLNPEKIVIGSIYARQKNLLEPVAMEIIERESLSLSRQVCEIVPAYFGESIGDYASLSIALGAMEEQSSV